MSLLDFVSGAGDAEEVRAVAAALAGLERDLHDAVQEHYEVLGIEPPADRQPPAERIDQLCRLVEHHLDDDLWGYFLAEQAPEGLKNPDEAARHANESDEAWRATLSEWVDEADAHEEAADAVVRERFGVDLDTFESRVVGWTPERTLREALRAPTDADIQRIRVATEALQRRE
jgi:hypothetical protein